MTKLEMRSDCAVCLQGVGKHYGRQLVLRAIDLYVGEGECMALIGHNGAGKTTLLKLVLGLTRPDTGSLRLWGQTPAAFALPQRGRSIGFLPEAIVFPGTMTGNEVLKFYAQLKGESIGRCRELLALVALDDVATRKVCTYSKGMRQRLSLAQALLGRPRLLVLDEPTAGLDPLFRRKFYEIIACCQSQGSTILLASHSLTEIEAQIDKIAIMQQGSVVTQGTMHELQRAANLPVRVRITARTGTEHDLNSLLSAGFTFHKLGQRVFDVECTGADKMRLLKQIVSEHGEHVEDVDITPPGLHALFDHFTENK